jgi:mRNA-degrading endonuclease RelE of RelBE toxin-antitoxin system
VAGVEDKRRVEGFSIPPLFHCNLLAAGDTRITAMPPFQIIFNPTSAAELARMPKELQLQILGEFRGLPQQVMQTELDQFGKLERAGRSLHRFRVGDYRVYFERHELGLVVHRILSRHTLKDFLFRSGLKMQEDEALQQNPKFWELIETARVATKNS